MTTNKLIIAAAASLLIGAPASMAQDVASDSIVAETVIPLLFDYPMPPDTLSSLEARAAWQMNNFWEPMNFNVASVDQMALNHAFKVYISSMRWAPEKDVRASISSLIKNIKKSPALTLQFAIAAETELYGPKAEVWSDDAYIPFIEAVVAQKKVPAARRARYERQLKILKGSLVGSPAHEIWYKDVKGSQGHYMPDGRWTIIEFGDPTCDVCRFSRLRLDANARFSEYVKHGRIGAFFIIPDPEDNWELSFDQTPSDWNIGAAPEIDEVYDIRATPSFYVIGPDKKIHLKNVAVGDALNYILANIDAEDNAKSAK